MLSDYDYVHMKSSKRETVKGKLGYKLGFYHYVKDHAILENDFFDRNYGIEDNESVFKIKQKVNKRYKKRLLAIGSKLRVLDRKTLREIQSFEFKDVKEFKFYPFHDTFTIIIADRFDLEISWKSKYVEYIEIEIESKINDFLHYKIQKSCEE